MLVSLYTDPQTFKNKRTLDMVIFVSLAIDVDVSHLVYLFNHKYLPERFAVVTPDQSPSTEQIMQLIRMIQHNKTLAVRQ